MLNLILAGALLSPAQIDPVQIQPVIVVAGTGVPFEPDPEPGRPIIVSPGAPRGLTLLRVELDSTFDPEPNEPPDRTGGSGTRHKLSQITPPPDSPRPKTTVSGAGNA